MKKTGSKAASGLPRSKSPAQALAGRGPDVAGAGGKASGGPGAAAEPGSHSRVRDEATHEAKFSDEQFWRGVDLRLPALAPVAARIKAGDRKGAAAALVAHFRTRTAPKISPYHTDVFWDDWPQMPVVERAERFLTDRVVVPSEHSVVPIDLKGKPTDPFEIDWGKAAKASIAVGRMRLLAELVSAYAQTNERKYAEGVEGFLRAASTALPFVLDPEFHPDEHSAFGGRGHEQLASCYRMFAWGDLLQSTLFLTPGVLSDEFWFWVLKTFLFFHLQFSRFVGAPFRADNHHLMERGVAVYFLGVQFPEFAFAAEMEAYAQGIIQRHFDHNILADGSGSEHCCSYQYRCFIRYALPDSVARLNGRDLLGPERAERMARFLAFQGLLTAPDGRQPDVGDGGGPSISEIVAQSGAMYESAELKAIDQAIGRRSVAVNPAFLKAYKKLQPRLPKELATVYPIGGHLALRDGWKKDSNFLWMGLKNGSLYNVHTHWDTLSFAMSAFGKRIIGDPVGRTYGRMDGLARGYYFSMDAHNGLIVDDDILSSHRALTRWWGGQPPRIDSAFTLFDAQGGFDYASFSHPGYKPLMLRRDVLFVHGRYFLITDGVTMDFSGVNAVFGSEGDIRPHEYVQPLHFEDGVPVMVQAAGSAKGADGADGAAMGPTLVTGNPDGPNLLIAPEPFENLSLSVKPDEYIAALTPAPETCVVGSIRRETIGKCFFSTVYRPFRGGPAVAPVVRVRSLTPRVGPYRQDEFHAVEICDGGRTDYWVVQRDRTQPKPIVIEQTGVTIRTDAAAVLISLEGRNITGFQCGGRAVELNGTRLSLRRRALTEQPLK